MYEGVRSLLERKDEESGAPLTFDILLFWNQDYTQPVDIGAHLFQVKRNYSRFIETQELLVDVKVCPKSQSQSNVISVPSSLFIH